MCRKSAIFVNVKLVATYSYHWALNDYALSVSHPNSSACSRYVNPLKPDGYVMYQKV